MELINVTRKLKLFIKSFYIFKTYYKYCENVLFITLDDKVFGYGENKYGVCGHGNYKRIDEPLIITELSDKKVKEFLNGYDFVLCLTNENQLFSWGMNAHGQLGIGCVNRYRRYEPQTIIFPNDKKIVQVCCGEGHSFVLTEDGVIYGWGNNRFGQTGAGQVNEKVIMSPKPLQINSKVIKIHCSHYQSFAITEDNKVYCCGRNDHCQLGSQLKPNECVFSLTLIDMLNNVENVITTTNNIYFVTHDGDIYYDNLSNDNRREKFQNVLSKISNLKRPQILLSSNYWLNCFEYGIIYSEGSIYELKFGEIEKTDYKSFDQYFVKKYELTYKTLNNNLRENNFDIISCKSITKNYVSRYLRHDNVIDKFKISDKIPESLKKIIKYFHIFNTDYYYRKWFENALFVTIDDKVFSLGENDHGLLGLGHNQIVEFPEIIPELCDKNIKEFSIGENFCLGFTKYKLFSWGRNNHGQLGIGEKNSNNIFIPKLIEYFVDMDIVQVCCGQYHSSVLLSDGRIFLWGKYQNKYELFFPTECEFVENVKLIHCSPKLTIIITKNGNVFYFEKKDDKLNSTCIDTMSNIECVCSSNDYFNYTYFISRDSIIYVFKNDNSKIQMISVITNFNLEQNFSAISIFLSNSVIYNENCVYLLYEDECIETKYKNPFDYYCDKEEVTFKTIEIEVEEELSKETETINYFMDNFI